jgi:hypothetical protein
LLQGFDQSTVFPFFMKSGACELSIDSIEPIESVISTPSITSYHSEFSASSSSELARDELRPISDALNISLDGGRSGHRLRVYKCACRSQQPIGWYDQYSDRDGRY